MPTVKADVGAADANSFVTRAAATTYLDARLNSGAWTNASNDDKDRALIEATKTISLLDFIGLRVDEGQALSWPRAEAVNPDSPGEEEFAADVLPQRVVDATCELALEFLKAGTTDLEGVDETAAIVREKTGPLETEYSEPWARPKGLARFKRVYELLVPLLEDGGSSHDLVRG
jgi:hypothetical protein